MSGVTIAVAIVVVVAVIVVAAVSASATRRKRLRERFGPEYDRAVEDYKSQRKADTALAGRERRVRSMRIRPLTAAERAGYRVRWSATQERFVDQPGVAIADARALVTAVLRDRGYPADDYGQILADLSVDYARNLGHYRSAHALSSAANGAASTEDLRQAMIHYRAMFDDVLGELTAAGGAANGVAGDGAVDDPAIDDRMIGNGAVNDGVIEGREVQGTPVDGQAAALAAADRTAADESAAETAADESAAEETAADESADMDGGYAGDDGDLSDVDDHSGQIRNG